MRESKLTHSDRIMIFNGFFAAAAIIVWTPLLHPIHEWGHVIFAGTANATIVDWSTTYIKHWTYEGLMGGFWVQLALGTLLMLLFRKWWPLQGFGLGYLSMTFIFAFISKDFESLYQMGIDPATVNLRWMLVSLPILGVAWGGMIHKIKVKAPKSDASAPTPHSHT
jgi:hypothetical protein